MESDNRKTTDGLNLETIALQVCDIAREAGAYIKKERASFSVEKVERKHAHDYVSYVDKGSEQLIVKALRRLLPEAGFITEEGTAKGDDVGCLKDEEGCTWVVDPLGRYDELHSRLCTLCSLHCLDSGQGDSGGCGVRNLCRRVLLRLEGRGSVYGWKMEDGGWKM